MKINSNGKRIKYLVTSLGIRMIDEDHPEFNSLEYAVFEDFEEAAMFAIQALSQRIEDLGG